MRECAEQDLLPSKTTVQDGVSQSVLKVEKSNAKGIPFSIEKQNEWNEKCDSGWKIDEHGECALYSWKGCIL